MSRKIYAMLLPVIAVAAMAISAGTAQAAFHWYKCEKVGAAGTFNNNACTASGTVNEFGLVRLPFTSAKTMVDTFGTLDLVANNKIEVTCHVIDAGNIWNVNLATVGMDEITEFVNFMCSSNSEMCKNPKIVAKGLPWPTELGENVAKEPIDTIGTAAKPIEVTLTCEGGEPATFKGELKPKLINPTVSDPLIAKFEAGSGTLIGPGTLTATVSGEDRIVGFAHGENIFVKNP